nr:ribonuclease H-like domain-containing protein [Tanacetum cinerariifolium]
LQSIHDDHVADFHYMDDARIYEMQSKLEGLHKGYDRMQKILSKLNQLKAKLEDEDINLKFLRALPSSWSQVALTLKTKGRPLFNRFAKADSMKDVPPPLSGDYTSLSDHINLDESQMSYDTKYSTSSDSKSVSNDFVSCDVSDKSSGVNINEFASSDSSVKSSEPKPNDSTSCASTSSVSTSENKAEIESNVRTPIQEPIIVQELPSFSGNSFDKNENTSRSSCNKNGYFNKKAESRDAIFDENRFYSIPRPKDIISSSNRTQGGDLPDETPIEIPEPWRSCWIPL